MPELVELTLPLSGGYVPNAPAIGCPVTLQNTVRAGQNVWARSSGRYEVANGAAQTSATNVGARIFQYSTQRAEIEGALVSSRLPYAGLLRYQNAALLYLSELTSKQVYLDESAVTGLTTSATAGMLRVGIQGSPWSVYDAGFNAPTLSSGNVSVSTTGTKTMSGTTGVALCAWRSKTNAISAPSAITYKALNGSDNIFFITLPSVVSGQDGWVVGGTNWGDASGNVRIVRYVYTTLRGTFTATNGSPTLTAGASTRFLQDARVGDTLTIAGNDYVVLTVDSDTQITLASNISTSTLVGSTATMKIVAVDYRNGELGSLLSYDVAKPVRAAGIFSYAQRVFLWGCYGESSSSVTGSAIVPMLENNPEHIDPAIAILTSNGDDILNVWPGETRLFVGTPNTLESVTFTGSTDEPYKIRVLHQPGFRAAKNGVVFQDRFYGYSEKPLRTVVSDNIDTDFAVRVWSDMKSWDASRVVLATDPKNNAVLYCHYDGSATTTIIPFLTNLEIWNPPITVSGQIVDSTVINGTLYITILTGGNYRTYTWEGGTTGTASTPYIASQFLDAGTQTQRKTVKSFTVSGSVSNVRLYRVAPAGTYPDLTSTGAAAVSFTMSSSEKAEKEIRTHLPECRAVALRVDFPTAGTLDGISLRGYAKAGTV